MKKGEKGYQVAVRNEEVIAAIDKYVDTMREDGAPNFSYNNLFNLAAVKFLKLKGYLQEDKKYL